MTIDSRVCSVSKIVSDAMEQRRESQAILTDAKFKREGSGSSQGADGSNHSDRSDIVSPDKSVKSPTKIRFAEPSSLPRAPRAVPQPLVIDDNDGEEMYPVPGAPAQPSPPLSPQLHAPDVSAHILNSAIDKWDS